MKAYMQRMGRSLMLPVAVLRRYCQLDRGNNRR